MCVAGCRFTRAGVPKHRVTYCGHLKQRKSPLKITTTKKTPVLFFLLQIQRQRVVCHPKQNFPERRLLVEVGDPARLGFGLSGVRVSSRSSSGATEGEKALQGDERMDLKERDRSLPKSPGNSCPVFGSARRHRRAGRRGGESKAVPFTTVHPAKTRVQAEGPPGL